MKITTAWACLSAVARFQVQTSKSVVLFDTSSHGAQVESTHVRYSEEQQQHIHCSPCTVALRWVWSLYRMLGVIDAECPG